MADGTRDNPLNVNIVDMMGAASLQQMASDVETGMSQFRGEISAIKESIDALNINVEESVKAQKDLADSFSKFYAGGGYSSQSSRQFSNDALLGPNGQPISGGTTAPGSRSSHASTPETPFDPEDFGIDDYGITDKSLREAIKNQYKAGRSGGRGIFESGLDAALKFGRSTGGIDLPESPVNAGAANRGGKSSGASVGGGGNLGGGGSNLGGTPMSFMSESPEPLQIPQFGEFQADTLLRAMGGMAQRYAQHRVQQGGAEDLRGKLGGTAAMGLYKAAEFAPKAALVKQYARGLGFTADKNALMDQGQMANAYGTTGQVDLPGPLPGFSVPILNPTYIKGIQEEFQRGMRAAGKPGLNMREASFVDEQLYKEGFGGDDGGYTNQLRDAGDRLMQINKRAGNNEMSYQILARASRTGQGSLSELVSILGEDLPKAAKAAKVSQEQLTADILSYSEAIENSGGTTAQAARNVSTMGQLGIAPSIAAQYSQNPFFQSTAYRQTGLMPMTQGAMHEGDVAQAFFGSLNDVAQMSSGFSDISRQAPGMPGRFGLKSEYSKFDQQIGMMSQFTGISADYLRKMMDPKTGRIRAGFENMANVSSGMSGLVGEVDPSKKNIDYNKVLDTSERYSKDGAWSYGEQIKMLRGSEVLDENGKVINVGKKYKDDIDKLATYKQDEIRELQKGGVHGKERGQVAKIMAERQEKMEKFVSDKNLAGTQTPKDEKVEVVLAGAAKSFFKLIDKRENAKDVTGFAANQALNAALGPTAGSLVSNIGDILKGD